MGIAFACWEGPVPAQLQWLTRSVRENAPLREYSSDCSVLVLGTARSNSRARRACACDVDHFGGRVLVVREEDRDRRIGDAALRAIGTPIPAAQLVSSARQAHRELPLQRMSVAAWLGRRFANRADVDLRALRVVPRLERLQADEWLQIAHLTRRRLESLTNVVFGASPGAAIRRYRLGTAEWLRSQGHSLREVAPVTGYSSKSALCRALGTQQRRGFEGELQNC